MHPKNDNSDNSINNVINAHIANVYDPVDFLEEFKAIQAESLGWIPLAQGVYLHCAAQTNAGKSLSHKL